MSIKLPTGCKLIYKKATQNYYRLYSRSKNNAKTVQDLPHVQQTWARFGSMPVPITHLFIGIIKKWGRVVI